MATLLKSSATQPIVLKSNGPRLDASNLIESRCRRKLGRVVGSPGIRRHSPSRLRAVWSASAAIMIWRRRDWFQNDWDWGDMAATMFWVLGVPIVLHALYDTLLKRDMNGWALVAALGSFAWLVVITEWTRRQEFQLA